jgi:hypothetical protein
MPTVIRRSCVFLALLTCFTQGLPAQGTCVTGTNASLAFDGDDWVRVPPSLAFSGFGDFTLEGWYKATLPAGSYPVIVSSWGGTGSPSNAFLFRVEFGQLRVYLNNVAGSLVGGSGLNDGAWHHAACSRVGSVLRLYVDGVVVATGSFAPVLNSGSTVLSMGVHVDSGPNTQSFHRGLLDEIRVWNVGRSATEINATRFTVLNGNEPGLVGYWRLNDGAGQVVTNHAAGTGAALNGTLGANNATFNDDPTWSLGDSAPIVYCAPGLGQPNTAAASLRVNGVGSPNVRGPFFVAVETSGPRANLVTFDWSGPPLSPLLLLTGSLVTTPLSVPCVGNLDLSLVGLTFAADYYALTFPLNLLFILDPTGHAQTTFSVPTPLLGTPWVELQGAVLAPGCGSIPYKLTAAFQLR